MMKKNVLMVFAFVLAVASLCGVLAQSANYVTYQNQAGYGTDYTQSNAETYWPQLTTEREDCTARQDLILQVAPGGCQPAVVRSDLLADQNVPVFCQVDALYVNPLVDIKQIRNIRFGGSYPQDVVGTGFQPARAALKDRDMLLGNPLVNNIGYVVVVLKKNAIEKNLPETVEVNLTAQMEYESGNAFGIGRSEFLIEQKSKDEASSGLERMKNSFWNGRYSLVLENSDVNSAEISVYDGDRRISTVNAKKGEKSNDIYMPGTYCSAALNIVYDGLLAAKVGARLEVKSDGGTDSFDVYAGSNFLNNKCTVEKITPTGILGEGIGNVTMVCDGKRYTLELKRGLIVGMSVALKSAPQDAIGVIESMEGDDVKVKGVTYKAVDLKPASLSETKLSGEGNDDAFNEIIAAYEKVADDFQGEMTNSLGISTLNQYSTYGESALRSALQLALDLGKYQTAERILLKLKTLYPNSASLGEYESKLSRLYNFDLSTSSFSVYVNGKNNIIRVTNLNVPGDMPRAIFTVDNNPNELVINEGSKGGLTEAGSSLYVNSVEPESVRITEEDCDGKDISYTMRAGEIVELCSKRLLRLVESKVESAAKIRVLPKTMGTGTTTNLTVRIGIEKRGIQLSPDKARDRVKSLNKSIESFEKISEKLGKVVETFSTACLATSLTLTIKNFASGASGEALARQQTMEIWGKKCQSMVPGQYETMTKCYSMNSGTINSEIANRTKVIQNVNKGISENVENQPNVSSGSFIFGRSVDQTNARDIYLEYLKKKYPNDAYVQSLNRNSDGTASYTYQDLRELDYNLELQKNGLASAGEEGLAKAKDTISKQADTIAEAKKVRAATSATPAIVGITAKQEQAVGDIVPVETKDGVSTIGGKKAVFNDGTGRSLDSGAAIGAAMFVTAGQAVLGTDGKPTGEIITSNFVVLGNQVGDKLNPAEWYEYTVNGEVIELRGGGQPVKDLMGEYSISGFVDASGGLEKGVMDSSQIKVSYFGSGPDKGLASLVPFRPAEGWYVRIDSSLDVGKNIPAYDASGLPKSWWICNVGRNGLIDSQDSCYLYVSGMAVGEILGVKGSAAQTLLSDSRRAIMDANNQRNTPSGQMIDILGTKMQKGASTSVYSGTECQDFMSIQECNLLFNVCDPVVCPVSRCNLGGKYQVDNVIETGIIGSLFLCMPNAGNPKEGGVFVPICLSGVKAGVDSWMSMLKDYRDCLQRNVDTGEMVGICDQIHSVYLCDILGKQLSPVLSQLLPSMVEAAYGGGQKAKGGNEYLTVQTAWSNAKSTMDYIASSYTTDANKAFQIKSLGQITTEFCKMQVSGKSPDELKSLIEPDSPPQYHAWLSSSKFSSATVPATYQYKASYHVFAGNSAGVSFSIYLKSSTRSEQWTVANGYADQGQYKSETKDFTAPEGFDEVCIRINNAEHCGFGLVSTSYALNTLTDNYANEQITEQNIKATTACVSGSESTSALLTNLNPQAAVEGALFPDISNKGIIRICSSTNPGASTEPTRYRDVGYCDTSNVRCWLDTNSVNNAISDNNVGLKNATMTELNANFNAQISEGILADVAGVAEVKNISELASKLKYGEDVKAESIKKWIDLVYDKFVMNNHKAALLGVRAMVLEKKYNLVNKKKDADKAAAPTVTAPAGPATSSNNVPVFGNGVTLVFDSGTNDIVVVWWDFEFNKARVSLSPNGNLYPRTLESASDPAFGESAVTGPMYPVDIAHVKTIFDAKTPLELSQKLLAIVNSGRASFDNDGNNAVTIGLVNTKLYGVTTAPAATTTAAATTPSTFVTPELANVRLELDVPYNPATSQMQVMDLVTGKTGFYLQGTGLFISSTRIGSISDGGVITLLDKSSPSVKNALSTIKAGDVYYDYLSGATVIRGEIGISPKSTTSTTGTATTTGTTTPTTTASGATAGGTTTLAGTAACPATISQEDYAGTFNYNGLPYTVKSAPSASQLNVYYHIYDSAGNYQWAAEIDSVSGQIIKLYDCLVPETLSRSEADSVLVTAIEGIYAKAKVKSASATGTTGTASPATGTTQTGTGYSEVVSVAVEGYSSVDYRFDRAGKTWQYMSTLLGWYNVDNMKVEAEAGGKFVYADEYLKITNALVGRDENWGKSYFINYAKSVSDSGTIACVPYQWMGLSAGTGYSEVATVTVEGYSPSADYRFDRAANIWTYSIGLGWYDVRNMRAEPGSLVYPEDYMNITKALTCKNETWGKDYLINYKNSGTSVSVPPQWLSVQASNAIRLVFSEGINDNVDVWWDYRAGKARVSLSPNGNLYPRTIESATDPVFTESALTSKMYPTDINYVKYLLYSLSPLELSTGIYNVIHLEKRASINNDGNYAVTLKQINMALYGVDTVFA